MFEQQKSDLRADVANLPREEQIKSLEKFFDKFCNIERWDYAYAVCELLADEYNYFGFKFEKTRILYKMKQYKAAAYSCVQLLEEAEQNSAIILGIKQPLLFCAMSYFELNDLDEAYRFTDLLIQLINDDVQRRIGNNPNADLSEENSSLALAYSLKGKIFFYQRKYEAANEIFDNAYRLAPTFDTMYYKAYMFYHGLGISKLVEYACMLFENIIKLENECDDKELIKNAYYYLGKIYSTEQGYINMARAQQCLIKAGEYGYELTAEDVAPFK